MTDNADHMADEGERLERARAALGSRNQLHVLRWWHELSTVGRLQLLQQIESIPWPRLDPIISTHIVRRPAQPSPLHLEPVAVYRSMEKENEASNRIARNLGESLLRQGKVAAFTVAGGQGSRLGWDGPKGTLPVTPCGGKSLFELFALMVRAARRNYSVRIPWLIMTSDGNHEQTMSFFRRHDHFGLLDSDVRFLMQGSFPAFDTTGQLLMESKESLALAPDGHGGSLQALISSGAVQLLKSEGIDLISYFQVDNPLVRPFDPVFLGLHRRSGSQMSTKVCKKADDQERVGNVCQSDGKVVVVEYSDFPESAARRRTEKGLRMFDSGNLAIHLLDVDFIERVTTGAKGLPIRRAEKAIPYCDESGVVRRPSEPNAVKLETFVFDVLPMARNPLVFEVDRAEEFSPVKNASGPDSLETSKQAQSARACRWLQKAGIQVPHLESGVPGLALAISPLFAMDAEELFEKRDRLPTLTPGAPVWIE